MGFAEGMSQGINLGNSIKRNKREERQQQLTAQMSGYGSYDEEAGEWIPTENRQAKSDIESQQLKATMQAVTSQMKNMQAKTNMDSMSDISEYMIENDYEGVNQTLEQNPALKRQLAEGNFDISNVAGIDFAQDSNLLRGAGIAGIDKYDFTDLEDQELFRSQYFKTQGRDGKWKLQSVDSMNRGSNLYNNLDNKRRDMYTKRVRNINSLLAGKGITTAEEGQTEATAQAATKAAQLAGKSSMEDVKYAYMISHPEVFAGKGGSDRRDALRQQEEAFFKSHPNPTQDEISGFYQGFLDVKQQGVSNVGEDIDLLQLKTSQAKAKKYNTGELEYNPSDAQVTENTIIQSLDGSQKTIIKDNIKKMSGNYTTIKMANRLLNSKMESVDKDVVANVKQSLTNLTGLDENDKKAIANINFNTSSGMLFANYINEKSGTAYSQNEIDMIKGILLGGNWSDETVARKAIGEFSRSLEAINNSVADTIRDSAPYSTRKLTDYGKKQTESGTKPSAADFD